MTKVRRSTSLIVSCIACLGCFISLWIFYSVNTGKLYDEYGKLWEYRRMHPEFQPQEQAIRIFDAGHSTTYADFLWINLIQYIADNIGNGKYTDYMTPLIETISKLHPHFTRSYTLALLLTPSLDPDNPSYETNRRIGKRNLEIGIRGIRENCDPIKVAQIRSGGIAMLPWKDTNVRNPCHDGFLPYYAGFIADGIGDRKLAEEYYTLASANSDAPEVSRFLALIMQGKSGDRLSAAIQFFLIAGGGYDESPYTCQDRTLKILSQLKKDTPIPPELISMIKSYEGDVTEPKDTRNPLASSTTNCAASFHRGVKQLYLAYITEKSKKYPEIKDGYTLIQRGIMISIPIPREYTGRKYTVKRQGDGRWEYRQVLN